MKNPRLIVAVDIVKLEEDIKINFFLVLYFASLKEKNSALEKSIV